MLMYFGRVPNFILAFIPEEINADTLNTMTAFAVSTTIRSLCISVLLTVSLPDRRLAV